MSVHTPCHVCACVCTFCSYSKFEWRKVTRKYVTTNALRNPCCLPRPCKMEVLVTPAPPPNQDPQSLSDEPKLPALFLSHDDGKWSSSLPELETLKFTQIFSIYFFSLGCLQLAGSKLAECARGILTQMR